jgi:DNA-binding CsgD family transcriptional regulator/tetratricopeptide (TPR) repeat protein/DNA-binding MarR family transcriptional regulator
MPTTPPTVHHAQIEQSLKQELSPPGFSVPGFLGRAAAGDPRPLLVVGGDGMGKSHFLELLTSAASRAGFEVARVRPLAAKVPLLSITRLLHQLGRNTGPPPESVPEAIAALQSALRPARPRNQSRLIVVDDLHELPLLDLAVLEELVAEPGDSDVTIALSMRRGGSASTDALLHRAEVEQQSEVVELGPLTEEGVLSLTRSLEVEPVEGAFARDLLDATGGSPRYCTALLEQLHALEPSARQQFTLRIAGLEALPLPDVIPNAVNAQIAQLGSTELEVLQILSFLAESTSLADLVSFARVDQPAVEGALVALEQAGLVVGSPIREGGDLRFNAPSPLVRRVVRESTPLLEQVRLHRAIASMLEARGPLDPDAIVRLSWHYVRGGLRVSPERAADLLRAARELNRESRYDEVRELLTRTLSLSSMARHPDLAAEARELLAQALAHSGLLPEAEHLLEAYTRSQRADLSPDVRANLLRRLARIQVAAERDDEAVRTYESIVEGSAQTAPQLRPAVLCDLANVHAESGRPEAALEISRDAAEEAEALGEGKLASIAWGRYGIILTAMGNAEEALVAVERALALARSAGSARAEGRSLGATGKPRIDLGDLRGGVEALLEATELSRELDDMPSVCVYASNAALAQYELGEWDDADRFVQLALSIDEKMHRERSLKRSRARAVLAASFRGDWGALPADDDHSTWPRDYAGLHLWLAAFRHAMFVQDFEEASRATSAMEALLAAWPGHDRVLYREVLPRKAILLAELRDPAGLDAVASQFARFDAATRGAIPLIATLQRITDGLAAGVRGDWECARDLLETGIDELSRLGYRWRAAQTVRYLAIAHRELGAEEQSAALLKSAFRELAEIGAMPDLEPIRADLRAMNRRPPRLTSPSDVLSSREWDVVMLASQGMTDREIAECLWLSRRTVSTHMHRVLRKLALRSRVELGPWVESQGVTVSTTDGVAEPGAPAATLPSAAPQPGSPAAPPQIVRGGRRS